ncbi:MAG TPA: transposase [Ktedonobacterales bacterium]|nr:transposase [Ktedonobacterales bacterium]
MPAIRPARSPQPDRGARRSSKRPNISGSMRRSETPEAPVILSARPLLTTNPMLAKQLREARCELLLTASWERLVAGCEKTLADIVLVDYDAAERARHSGRQHLSGHRLVSLLARGLAAQARERPLTLVVLTQLDYAELEDLMRLGVHALEHPDDPNRLTARILAAYQRAVVRFYQKASQPLLPAAPSSRLISPIAQGAASRAYLSESAWTSVATALAMAGVVAQRARVSDRAVFEGLCQLLQSGAPWRAYPDDCGSVSLARRRLALWRAAGVFIRLGWLAQAGNHEVQAIMALPWARLGARATTSLIPERVAAAQNTRSFPALRPPTQRHNQASRSSEG